MSFDPDEEFDEAMEEDRGGFASDWDERYGDLDVDEFNAEMHEYEELGEWAPDEDGESSFAE